MADLVRAGRRDCHSADLIDGADDHMVGLSDLRLDCPERNRQGLGCGAPRGQRDAHEDQKQLADLLGSVQCRILTG